MKKIVVLVCVTSTTIGMNTAWSEEETEQASTEETKPASVCISTNPKLGDSANWATTAVIQFSEEEYVEAVTTVDTCFPQWGPAAGHQQKAMYDEGAKCPAVGAVSSRVKKKIHANGLLNDVSMALWAKARSLHELGQIDAAKKAYSQCIYMACGRAWDPKGWFWNPSEDCSKRAKKLMK